MYLLVGVGMHRKGSYISLVMLTLAFGFLMVKNGQGAVGKVRFPYRLAASLVLFIVSIAMS